ncbi:54S ribosomal protein yml6, mitochondrial [Yamadazyma tenuis]|uniref:Large ribosomal subunit protein uL4m n=1 Tax=Candida tenuis (strain ATCC 10573 / BCRC 21748 / CBS 615 / JCM 9827 / NBRC 10315 / NRRL Y-1498 / VKM Y-70) TaxID=590646 RepID=G3B061_CANTC|nr:ribosomal protein L4 [Yamadazyma tenuis ATCC 10573]XP_006685190.1 uncharacterized protein CANTEDRAFT_113045 [Yamadazyma tenuis ATCC 10573]EGV65503.1 ribosomal protein L4 [Yamadazyma tenuis ATCC 10573]EGV65504.1 hypothetical protein CANTEDRAFT_113045 [Yamadazyma tenuis ATCC 10573]WEJ95018.1 54S ribosomal protein yml6, mitochondrial [Yamadazyma tenuis]
MFKQVIRGLATEAKFNIRQPPKYTLGSVRSFPSLEPHQFVPLPTQFLGLPTRRDLLWSAVVFEADRARVGSGNAMTKSDQLYSHKKLRPQKGSGRARVGDANSPHRDNLIKAHAITAPHDWSTKLPVKIYNKAMATALSEQYQLGRVYIVGETDKSLDNDNEKSILDFNYEYPETMKQFIRDHHLNKMNLLFITDGQRDNLLKATELSTGKADVLVKDAVEVRDVLKANRIYIELPALQWLIGRYM